MLLVLLLLSLLLYLLLQSLLLFSLLSLVLVPGLVLAGVDAMGIYNRVLLLVIDVIILMCIAIVETAVHCADS